MHSFLSGGLATLCLVAGARWALQPLEGYAVSEGEPVTALRAGRLRLLQWEAFGLYYGFPACCTLEFMANRCADTQREFPNGPWLGSGFIPCACCAPVAQDMTRFISDVIQPQRLCSTPFPDEGPDAVADAIIAMVHAPGWTAAYRRLLSWRRRIRQALGTY
jgi:hypothetical protein